MSLLEASRSVLPEILDHLAPEDPQAQRSRRDLRRVNHFMGACSLLAAGLHPAAAAARRSAPLRLLELGAGDGQLMLRVARMLTRRGESAAWHAVELQLLDRQALVAPEILQAYARCGWRAQPLLCDVRDWVAERSAAAEAARGMRYDVIVTNLFLHHFEPPALRALLAAIAAHCERFLACEPRRSGLALLGSHLLGAIGANRVTRHDAVVSVRAGFRDAELSGHWPSAGWQLEERAAGLFSHYFAAWRTGASPSGEA